MFEQPTISDQITQAEPKGDVKKGGHIANVRRKPFPRVRKNSGIKSTDMLGRVRDLGAFMEKARQNLESSPENERAGLTPLLDAWQQERNAEREEKEAARRRIEPQLFQAGAHFLIDGIWDPPHVLGEIEDRLAHGERPFISDLAVGRPTFADSAPHRIDRFGDVDPLSPAFLRQCADARSEKITG